MLMLEYRCAELDDEMDEFDEPAGVNLDDDLGEYEMDDDDPVTEIIVTETLIIPEPVPAMAADDSREAETLPVG